MATALVLGVNGQDGTLLAQRLLARGYHVVGIGRQDSSRHVVPSDRYLYRKLDLRTASDLSRILAQDRPDLIFHFAAVHRSAEGGPYELMFGDMLRVNIESLQVALEYIRTTNPRARLIYAGSAKVFGEPYPAIVDEHTSVVTTCLYSLTKIAALELIQFYRRKHGVHAAYLYLFNHESKLRAPEYFVPKLVAALRSAIRGEQRVTSFNTLQFWCDWGSAEEYMDLAIEVAERATANDFIIATGRSHLARDLVEQLFQRHGLDSGQFVVEKADVQAPQRKPYAASTDRLQAAIGRMPSVSIDALCELMLQ